MEATGLPLASKSRSTRARVPLPPGSATVTVMRLALFALSQPGKELASVRLASDPLLRAAVRMAVLLLVLLLRVVAPATLRVCVLLTAPAAVTLSAPALDSTV